MNVMICRRLRGCDGTFGLVTWDGMEGRSLVSGELPWKNNQQGISCIPAGTYQIAKVFSPHFNREVYQVQNVPGRSDVEIHPANWMGDTSQGLKSDLLGCIAMGCDIQVLPNDQLGLLESTVAITKFEQALGGNPATLTITDL